MHVICKKEIGSVSYDLLLLLIKTGGANVNVCNPAGDSALHILCRNAVVDRTLEPNTNVIGSSRLFVSTGAKVSLENNVSMGIGGCCFTCSSHCYITSFSTSIGW